MRIWLDDIRPAPDGFFHVRNLAELQVLLAENPDIIEVMSFDHDLGDEELDGYDIIKWIAKNHIERWPLEIRVHSANTPGRENIEAYVIFIRERVLA